MILRLFFRSFTAVLTFVAVASLAQEKGDLTVADSLFADGKYTEAMEQYEQLIASGYGSASSLLKMAYVADARSDYASALYYLDLYYKVSGDRLAVGKIEELAEQHALEGYDYTDLDYLAAVFSKFRLQAYLLVLTLITLLLVYSYRKIKQHERPYAALLTQFFFALVLLVLVNFKSDQRAIIATDNALLRSGPSAGADAVSFLQKGHRVVVLSKTELWSKILWEGEEAFIRTSRLKSI